MRGSEFTSILALGSQGNKHINAPSLELSCLAWMFTMGSPSKCHASLAMGSVLCFRPWEHAVPVDQVLFLSCIVRWSSWRGSRDLRSLTGRRETENSQGIQSFLDFPVAQTVKNLPAMQETGIRSLGWEVPMEQGMGIHSSTLAWRIPWAEKPGRLQFVGSQRIRHN